MHTIHKLLKNHSGSDLKTSLLETSFHGMERCSANVQGRKPAIDLSSLSTVMTAARQGMITIRRSRGTHILSITSNSLAGPRHTHKEEKYALCRKLGKLLEVSEGVDLRGEPITVTLVS